MFVTAADAKLLVDSMQTPTPMLEQESRAPGKAPHSEVLATLAAVLALGHGLSWARTQGGCCQLAALWLCIEMAWYTWNRWRCVPTP